MTRKQVTANCWADLQKLIDAWNAANLWYDQSQKGAQPMHNKEQHKESRMRDEGKDSKHMREDHSVPIMGKKGAAIHGCHTGEMCTDDGMDRIKSGKSGDHEEDK